MRTRLAPSPTGALHLGNARTFLVNWALARQRSWRVTLRIEDLDGPRVRPAAAAEAIDVLAWLGLEWDDGPVYQSHDLAPYRAALRQLAAQGDVYPCRCTRREIAAAAVSAPHADDHELRYNGACRPPHPQSYPPAALDDRSVAWRLRVPEGAMTLNDRFAGPHEHDVLATSGDFIVAAKEGVPSYQLAVVVDDARQGITHIVRGDDLLASTHRQRLLQQRLGLPRVEDYVHLPLVVGADGRRLAKRHGDSRISYYRGLGVTAERILGLLAYWCGMGPPCEMTSEQFAARFELERLPRERIVFTAEDVAWLLAPLPKPPCGRS